MASAQEAGHSSLIDFSQMDGEEYKAWMGYVMSGPSQFRTQVLLAQIIQMVSMGLGGKNISLEKILPYYAEFTGSDTLQGQARRREKLVSQHESMVESLLSKQGV